MTTEEMHRSIAWTMVFAGPILMLLGAAMFYLGFSHLKGWWP